MAAIFLSYAQNDEDKARVKRIQSLLEAADYKVYRDEDSISNGELIPNEIVRMIENASYFMLCHSQHAEQSAWVNWECGIATLRAQKRGFEFKIVRLGSTEPQAHNLNRLYGDLTDLFAKSDAEVTAKLKGILKNHARQLILRLMLRISLTVLAGLALTSVGGILLLNQMVTETPLAWYDATKSGKDPMVKAENEDIEVLVYSSQRVNHELVVDLELINKKDGAELYFTAAPELAEALPFQVRALYLVQNGKSVALNSQRLLIGTDLPKGHGGRLQVHFPFPTQAADTFVLHYSNSWYGAQKTLTVPLPYN